MGKRLKFSSIIALLLVAALVVSACSSGGGEGSSGEKVLNLTESQEPPNLDSAKSTDTVSFNILNQVMEGLYRLDKDGNPILGMAAEEPQVSDDKKTYTFKIRDAKWSDGQPVKAQDFEYAWKRALNPETASEYAYILYPLLNAEKYNLGQASADEVGVKALDDKTLEVKLETPIPYFKDLLTFPTYLPQRQDIVEKYGKEYALEAQNMVYNGPFVLTEWKHNQSFQYKKNPDYWDSGAVKLDTVNVTIVKDQATSINLYKTGQVDYSPLGTEFIDAYKDSPEKFVINESAVFYLELNQTKDFFKNKKIRQAINLAVDKKLFVDNILKNGSQPAGGIVPPDIRATGDKKFRELSQLDPQFNAEQAKQLFQEGLQELGMSSPPAKLELVGDDTSGAKKSLEFIQEQLRVNLGLETQIVSVPFKERLERGKSGRFDIIISGWGADYNDPMTYLDLFTSDNAFNRGKWSNSEFDQLIKKSKANVNFEERVQDLIQAEKIFIEDAGIVPLYYRSRLGLKKDYIKDWYWHVIGPEYTLKWTDIQK